MSDSNPFSRLLTGFQEVFASGRSHGFAITLLDHAIHTSESRSPKRIRLCEIVFPVLNESDGGEPEIHDCLFAVTVPRNKGAEDIGDKFAVLAREAGAACAQLPADFQSRLSSHCPAYIQTPASWWVAMLWEFQGGGLFGTPPAAGYSGPRAVISRPFLVSIEAISQCGLQTETPKFRERETASQGGSDTPNVRLDVIIIGGVTPMPADILGAGDQPPKPKASDKPPRKATVNERMSGMMMDNHEVLGWNSTQWAQCLKCARSTVVETLAWKKLESARLVAKAERRKDRRRKPKASDLRRD